MWYVCYYPTLIAVALYVLAGSEFFPWQSLVRMLAVHQVCAPLLTNLPVLQGFWSVFPSFSDWYWPQPRVNCTPDLRARDRTAHPAWYFYYMFQLGFYIQGMVALVSFETKRKDFVELVLHHSGA